MKVAVNRCWGGFSLSKDAITRCNELGLNVKDEYDSANLEEKEFRSHPVLIQVLEELGPKANGEYSKITIVEIPFVGTNGWNIHDHDGQESIQEEHRSW